METIIYFLIPIMVTVYFYGLPNIFIGKYVDNFIDKILRGHVENYSDTKTIKKKIYGMTGLMSYLGFLGGISVFVIGDKAFIWNEYFVLCVVLFVLFSFVFVKYYYENSLVLTKRMKYSEYAFVSITVIIILINIFIR